MRTNLSICWLFVGCGNGTSTPVVKNEAGPTATPPSMIKIEAGPFLMGCDKEESGCTSYPARQVTVSTFYIDRTEVIVEAYTRCQRAGVCSDEGGSTNPYVRGGNAPVLRATWADADAYCRWVGKRLPTEAEWEKAARGTDGRRYPWGNEAPDCQRVQSLYLTGPGCTQRHSSLVGTHPLGASPYGVQDMSGNADEWVSDWFHPSYYSFAPAENPPGYDRDRWGRTVRGMDGGNTLTVTERNGRPVTSRGGFRCASSTPPRK